MNSQVTFLDSKHDKKGFEPFYDEKIEEEKQQKPKPEQSKLQESKLHESQLGELKEQDRRQEENKTDYSIQITSQESRIESLFKEILTNHIGPRRDDFRELSISDVDFWLDHNDAALHSVLPKIRELEGLIEDQRKITVLIPFNGTKQETFNTINNVAVFLYILKKRNKLEGKKIEIIVPNSDFSKRQKTIATIIQIATVAIDATVIWALTSVVPVSWMPNDHPWNSENSIFRNILPPFGMGLMIGNIASMSLASYLNTCPKKDRLGFMKQIVNDKIIQAMKRSGVSINFQYTVKPIERPRLSFQWE